MLIEYLLRANGAGLRPEEALALQWRHVRERTLLSSRRSPPAN
jgi:hypothetical protein